MPTKEYCSLLSARLSKIEERYDELLKEVTLLEIETRGNTFNHRKHVDMLEQHMQQIKKDLAPVLAHCKLPEQKACGFCDSVRNFVVRFIQKLQ